MAKQANQELKSIRPTQAIQLLERCMAVGRPAMLWGPPGIGKSDIVAGIGRKQKRPVIDLRLLLMEPTDLKGIPYYNPESKEMRWAKPTELPGEKEVDLHNAILFLDEINAAPQSVQAAAYQLILNRKVGEYRLPDGVSIVAAGNRETDKAVTFRMPSALANRFVHFDLTVNYEDWESWAIEHRISSDVLGFLKAHPQHLFNFNPKESGKAFATPRSWAFVSQLLDDDMEDSLNGIMVEGTVGQGLGIEFMQHRRLKGKLPNPRDILLGKVTSLNPDKEVDVSAKYSLMVGLCYSLEQLQEEHKNNPKSKSADWDKVTDTFLEFIMGETKGTKHFTTEMVIMGAVIALRKYDIEFNSDTKTFGKFFENYHKWIVNND